MTVSDKLTAIATALRSQYGSDSKYSLDDMAKGIGGLEAHNFVDEGQFQDSSVDSYMKPVSGLTVESWNKNLAGKTITISCDVEYSGYVRSDNTKNRIGFEICTQTKDGGWHYNGVWLYPTASDGKQHISSTWSTPNQEITQISSADFYDQINSTAKVKLTNLRVVLNPVGGVTRVNLLPNYEVRYLPQSNPANNFDCYAIYTDTSIKMEYGKKYEVIAETNGFFSNQHQPNVESNKCILWLTDASVYTQPISDEHTAQGTVFTWGGATGTYYLRVNAYHKSTTNTIYAYNIRIYEV